MIPTINTWIELRNICPDLVGLIFITSLFQESFIRNGFYLKKDKKMLLIDRILDKELL